MDYFELFQENPGLFFLAIAISLVLTLFIYGAFPVIFAKTRKTPITKKKYKRLCYGINFIGVVFFVALNGASNGAPYILWTWVFSNQGLKTLTTKGLLLQSEPEPTPPTTLPSSPSLHINDSGESNITASQTITPQDKPASQTPQVHFCRKCGAKLPLDANFCNKCGTKIQL